VLDFYIGERPMNSGIGKWPEDAGMFGGKK
jgi:hypothetical protein